MLAWLVALAIGAFVAFVQYGWRELRGTRGAVPLALMRMAAVTLVVALLLDAPAGPARPLAPWVALDASASMARGGDSSAWIAALEVVRDTRADSVFLFGSSVRPGTPNAQPGDPASLLRPLAERALGAGRPLVVVTDGELDDPDAVRALPAGSRVHAVERRAGRDLALAALELPRAAVAGDTIEVRATVRAGAAGSGAGTLRLDLDGAVLASVPVDALPPLGERALAARVRVAGREGPGLLRAVAASEGDTESRNDTLAAVIDLSASAAAVFVSTSPDFDARYALGVLRGAVAIPTRGFFRVAPGAWRVDGALTPVSEAEVRAAVRDAPMVVLHGDTAIFGAPRAATTGSLALVAQVLTDEGEWFATTAPASPLSSGLAGVAWDSLPPIAVSGVAPRGDWVGMEAQQPRQVTRRPVVAGQDAPRRVVVVAASGMWRWQFRGGAAADAYTAFWGALYDWLAAERPDRRAALPEARYLRAGQPVLWRRGGPADTVVTVVVERVQPPAWTDTLELRFPAGATTAESAPLEPGVYRGTVRGGSVLLAVNPSAEWIPRAPTVSSGAVSGVAGTAQVPRLRSHGWLFVLIVALLCAEWVMRRRQGLR